MTGPDTDPTGPAPDPTTSGPTPWWRRPVPALAALVAVAALVTLATTLDYQGPTQTDLQTSYQQVHDQVADIADQAGALLEARNTDLDLTPPTGEASQLHLAGCSGLGHEGYPTCIMWTVHRVWVARAANADTLAVARARDLIDTYLAQGWTLQNPRELKPTTNGGLDVMLRKQGYGITVQGQTTSRAAPPLLAIIVYSPGIKPPKGLTDEDFRITLWTPPPSPNPNPTPSPSHTPGPPLGDPNAIPPAP